MSPAHEDRLLDHNYDGIQEYDNPLPGWWVAIFLGTILFSIWYLVFYTVGIGTSVLDGYNDRAAAFYEAQAAQLAELEINEETIAALMKDPDRIAGMRRRFEAKCATCHGRQGEGGACPNLTDEHWIHGGRLLDIYRTIVEGVPGKEMKSWLDELGPGGVLSMAAFVGSIRGTHVAGGKAPEGKRFIPDEKPAPADPAAKRR
ncbi:MAG: cbb3-type cytochrome c oxidase N-terminal domain-containing protein [Planctomycetota bacterium]